LDKTALRRADGDGLSGEPIGRGFCQPAGTRQRGQPQSRIGIGWRLEDGERTVEDSGRRSGSNSQPLNDSPHGDPT